jgi:DNA replication protein DnaC
MKSSAGLTHRPTLASGQGHGQNNCNCACGEPPFMATRPWKVSTSIAPVPASGRGGRCVNPAINRTQIFDLATSAYIARHENILICGPTGVGKSHLAQAFGHEACRRGYDVLFMSGPKLLQHLQGGRADETYARRLQLYLRPELLIVDDFGLKPLTATQCEDWFDILAERYERGSLIVTSNRALSEWPDLFGNPILASAGLDRLFHNAHAITITGESFRARARHLITPADPLH